jgi:SRSO17 transposase
VVQPGELWEASHRPSWAPSPRAWTRSLLMCWSRCWRPVRQRLAQRLVGALEPTAWAVDDTGFPMTASSRWVQRQYSGTLGKTANCQPGVSANAVTEQVSG